MSASNANANANANDDNALYFDVQQKTDKQHILDNPDTYIGSVETVDANMWIMSENSENIIEKNISYIPGLFKLFDEGIINCRDHVVRMQSKVEQNVPNSLPVTYIDIAIQDDGTIVMINDGNGIDVVQHPEYKTWVPELIFGHLRTSTNYNKDEKKIVGGKNGFGFKLVLIWSTYGSVETVDHIRGLKYTQEFKDNLDTICEPKITKASKAKPYTKITFKPDYQRLGLVTGVVAGKTSALAGKTSALPPDLIALLKKRVYDISAVTDKMIKVKYNSAIIPTKNFEQYINLYIGDKSVNPRVYETDNPRWEYAVALTPTNEFIQVSFVNGIYTSKGGKHVEYVLNQITRKLAEYIEKKKKVKVNPNSIKEQLILFLRCDIENPSFDSQTKDFMNTPMTKFGSKCEVSDKFIEKVAKMGVMDAACAITEVKENKAAKKTDGTKSKSIRGIPKLDDANWAGTDKSNNCMIIFCEGDSAKTGVISGLSSEDRNTIGVYPLKGKVMNELFNILKGIAPTLATAVAGPLGGAAVTALASKLGVSDSVDAVAKAIAGDPAAAQKIAELELEYAKLNAQDRDSARKAYTAIATSENATKLDKLVVPILALGVVGLAFSLIGVLMFVDTPNDQQQLVIFALGFITSAAGQVLSFYFGSSQGSKDKTEDMKGMVKK